MNKRRFISLQKIQKNLKILSILPHQKQVESLFFGVVKITIAGLAFFQLSCII